jgi:hypothetical protein
MEQNASSTAKRLYLAAKTVETFDAALYHKSFDLPTLAPAT